MRDDFITARELFIETGGKKRGGGGGKSATRRLQKKKKKETSIQCVLRLVARYSERGKECNYVIGDVTA